MKNHYVLSIDQSTQGTKSLLFDGQGRLLHRCDLPHRQIVSEQGWISHNPEEIYSNVVRSIKNVVQESGIEKDEIVCMGISNQRETAMAWDKNTGRPVCDAIVWQCARSREICERVAQNGRSELIAARSGIPLSPYYPASKWAWILEQVPTARALADCHALCFGTVDTWLVYRLTGGKAYLTDYSNASRTQLFDITKLCWEQDSCAAFGIDPADLATVVDSDANFGSTDLEGFLNEPIPITGVLGDSHGALFGHGCLKTGMTKVTYGTGSSVMMNIGDQPRFSTHGAATSLAWSRGGNVQYVMEGNVNYTGAVIAWLEEIGLIDSAQDTQALAEQADRDDAVYLVPAFSGMGAPYWESSAKAAISGMTRRTGRAELVRAGLECIAYQITDVLKTIERDSGIALHELLVDGGATKNDYLMQFQCDMAQLPLRLPDTEELSGIGAAYMAGISAGVYNDRVFGRLCHKEYTPRMDPANREKCLHGWHEAVAKIIAAPGIVLV